MNYEVWEKGELSPRFISQFEILRKVGNVTYEITLPHNLSQLHNIIHVPGLKPYKSDFKHVIHFKPIQVNQDLSYEKMFI